MAQVTGARVPSRKLALCVAPGSLAQGSYFSGSLWKTLGVANIETLRIIYDALSISLAL